MSDIPPNVLGIWDLDRPDALLNLRSTFRTEKRIGQRSAGRFLVAVGAQGEPARSYPVADAATLERVVRETLIDQRSKGLKLKVLLKVAAETHAMVLAISAEANAVGLVVTEIHSTPS